MKLLTKKEIGQMFGINRKTISRWINELGLPIFRITPKKSYIREDDLLAWESAMKERNRKEGVNP